MNQKGFIPIIFIVIGAIVLASATFGVVKYKDEIAANVSKVFKGSKVEAPNIDSTGGDEAYEETELTEEPIIEEPKKDDIQLQEQLRIAEQKRLEAEKQLAEEKARQEEQKRKELERQLAEEQQKQEELKRQQELQRQLEAERLAEEQRRQEELQRQEEAQRLAEEQARQEAQRLAEEQRKVEEQRLAEEIKRKENILKAMKQLNSKLDDINNQLAVLYNKIEEKSAEIEAIKNRPISMEHINRYLAQEIPIYNALVEEYNSLLEIKQRIGTIFYELDDYYEYGTPIPAGDRAFLASLGIYL